LVDRLGHEIVLLLAVVDRPVNLCLGVRYHQTAIQQANKAARLQVTNATSQHYGKIARQHHIEPQSQLNIMQTCLLDNLQIRLQKRSRLVCVFMRRVRKAVGGNDKSASGATRLAGTENFKKKYIPDFPVVSIIEATPGRVVTTGQVEALGLVSPPEPVKASSVISLPSSRRQRLGGERQLPDYQRCLDRAPLSKEHGGPDRSSADFDFCKWAARFGWSV
jgi:hypothetical protein